MLVFLTYVFDEDSYNLNFFCKDEWLKIYDVQYVETLLATIASYHGNARDIISSLEDKVFLKKRQEEEAVAWAGASSFAKTTTPRVSAKAFKLLHILAHIDNNG